MERLPTALRTSAALVTLFCFGCTVQPSADEKTLISKVERIVRLPKGAGELNCYARHYALLQSKALDDYMGFPVQGLPGRKVLVGVYRRGDDEPGVHWAGDATKLPPKIGDGGCSDISVFHVVGDRERDIEAVCATNFAGVPPTEVIPPVTC